jgi:hypothetical protein
LHGYTTADNANKYEAVKKRELLPGISTVRGYIGSYLLRRMNSGEIEFTVNYPMGPDRPIRN